MASSGGGNDFPGSAILGVSFGFLWEKMCPAHSPCADGKQTPWQGENGTRRLFRCWRNLKMTGKTKRKRWLKAHEETRKSRCQFPSGERQSDSCLECSVSENRRKKTAVPEPLAERLNVTVRMIRRTLFREVDFQRKRAMISLTIGRRGNSHQISGRAIASLIAPQISAPKERELFPVQFMGSSQQ